jgi:hypothetical protein
MIDGIMANSIKQIGEVLLCWLFVHDFVVVVVVMVVIQVFGKSHPYFKVVRPCFRVVQDIIMGAK